MSVARLDGVLRFCGLMERYTVILHVRRHNFSCAQGSSGHIGGAEPNSTAASPRSGMRLQAWRGDAQTSAGPRCRMALTVPGAADTAAVAADAMSLAMTIISCVSPLLVTVMA